MLSHATEQAWCDKGCCDAGFLQMVSQLSKPPILLLGFHMTFCDAKLFVRLQSGAALLFGHGLLLTNPHTLVFLVSLCLPRHFRSELKCISALNTHLRHLGLAGVQSNLIGNCPRIRNQRAISSSQTRTLPPPLLLGASVSVFACKCAQVTQWLPRSKSGRKLKLKLASCIGCAFWFGFARLYFLINCVLEWPYLWAKANCGLPEVASHYIQKASAQSSFSIAPAAGSPPDKRMSLHIVHK